MSVDDENPFVRFGLDPEATLAELTERLRELAEDADDDAERLALRAAWESLTRSPARRLELVLEAGPPPEPIPEMTSTAPLAAWPDPTLAEVLASPPLGPLLPAPTADERALTRIDLGALVRDDEIAVTGDLTLGRKT